MTLTTVQGMGLLLDPDPLVGGAALRAASDAQLSALVTAVKSEQQRRALEGGDLDAIADHAFRDAFTSREPHVPWLEHGLLICPGLLVETSRLSHRCIFVAVGDHWCWEHPDTVFSDVRRLAEGSRSTRRSIAIIAAHDGIEYDVVSMRYRGVHEVQSIRSFALVGGVVTAVATRARRAAVDAHPVLGCSTV